VFGRSERMLQKHVTSARLETQERAPLSGNLQASTATGSRDGMTGWIRPSGGNTATGSTRETT
jgi:hypothetical protein